MELVERPRKPAPEEVPKSGAEQWAKEGVKVDWEKLLPPRGFQVLLRRWWWIGRFRGRTRTGV